MPRFKPFSGYVSLGSNMGNPETNIQKALELMPRTTLFVDAVSPLFWTEPQGLRGQAWFVNCVARILVAATTHPESILDTLLHIETCMGRVRTERFGPRSIDLDLLLLGATTWQSERLELPHPRMCARAFVLVPLMHLDADLRILGQTPAHWLARLDYTVSGNKICQNEP